MFTFLGFRRSIFFNCALFCLLIIVWCLSYMQPVLRSFFKEEHLLYGRVSYAAIPSVFGGTDIPFLDKTYFQINGDSKMTFVLYAEREVIEEMAEWLDFSSRNVEDVPLEISAVRINEDTFVIKSISSREGALDWEVVAEYHVYWSLVGLGIVAASFIAFVVFMILAIRAKPRRFVEAEIV